MGPRTRTTCRMVGTVAIAAVLVACQADEDIGVGDTTTSTEPEAATPTEAGATTTAGDGPVSLEGEVNDRGTETVQGGSMAMVLDDFFFDPTFVEGESGNTISVELTNQGSAPHTFTIEEQNIDVALDPGQSQTVEVTIEDSEGIRFFCRFHEAQGMQGALLTASG